MEEKSSTKETTETTETTETYRFASREVWQTALNQAPNDDWIHKRDLGKGRTSEYLPIPIQQALADVFFSEFDVYDAQFKVIANEILCTVKINILPAYPNSEYRIISGSGAKPIQCRSGSNPANFPQGKITNSLEYCSPAARTVAIGNALNTFANVFGRNIGRAIVSNGYNLNDNKKKEETKKDKK